MDLLDGLNPAQRQAVEAIEGPVLVLAGPGSGKTRVLTHRVAFLIKVCGVDPYNVMAVTFTNKAAREMKERLHVLLGEGRLQRLTIGTFHAICARILRREGKHVGISSNFVIYDTSDQLGVIKRALKELNLDDKMYRPPAVLGAISKAKSELQTPDTYFPPTYWHEVAGRVYGRYQALLRENNALDFDDLLMQTVRLFRETPEVLERYQRRYVHILVDEWQDTNVAQYELMKLLAGHYRNLFVVGDEDQSIYLWRGADYRNIRRFRAEYPESRTILLEQNYRSTQTVLDAAQAVIAHNTQRTPKKLWTERKGGPHITVYEAYDEQDEAQFVADEIRRLAARGDCRLGDCAVMYRTNAQSRTLEDAFVARGMPYKLVGATRFYARKEIKDVLAYLRLVHTPHDRVSLERVINVPPRGIGSKTFAALERWAGEMGVGLYRALQMLKEDEGAGPFAARARKALTGFATLLDELVAARGELNVVELLDKVLERSGYADFVQDGTEEGQDRWDNIQELRSVAREYAYLPVEDALTVFLEEVALVSDVDNLDAQADAPTLMTLHAAKGLEFPTVFIVGMEEGIFPHSRSFGEPEQMEEERRLCYVGLTRAKERLYLIHAFRRMLYGDSQLNERSRFIDDIPPELIKGQDKPRARQTSLGLGAGRYHRRSFASLYSAGSKESAKPAPAPVEARFRAGDRVRHARFGEGTVISTELTGQDEEVTVAFEDKGVKRLMVSFANLEKIEE